MNSSSDLDRRGAEPDHARRGSKRPFRGSVSVARFDEQFADPSKDRRGMATPEQAWTAGYEVGLEQGMSIGRASTVAEHAASDRRMALVGDALRCAADGALADVRREFTEATEVLIRAAFDIALAIVGRDLHDRPRTGEEALRAALALVPPRVACTARLHPSDLDDLGTLDTSRLHPDLSIVADYSVESGDCVIDLPSAQIENRLADAIARVRAVLGSDVDDTEEEIVS